MVQVGPLKLTGPAALVAALAILGLIPWLIVLSRPRPSMLLAGAIWVGFTIYWSATAVKAPPSQRAESAASRQRHQMLLDVALLLLFVPIPGLRLPLLRGAMVPAIGLGVEVAGALLYLWAKRDLGRNWSGEISVQAGPHAGAHRSLRQGATPHVHSTRRHGGGNGDRVQPAARRLRRHHDGVRVRAQDHARGALDGRGVRGGLRRLSPRVVGADP